MELGGAHGENWPALGRLTFGRPYPDRLGEALGAVHERRHRAFDLVPSLIALALGLERAALDLEFARAGYLRDSEQLSDLRPDLAGLRVERIFAHQDQVERLAFEPHRERPRGRQRVRAGEGAILEMDA